MSYLLCSQKMELGWLDFNLPPKSTHTRPIFVNIMINDELAYNIGHLVSESDSLCARLNSDKKSLQLHSLTCCQQTTYFFRIWVWRYWKNVPLKCDYIILKIY